MTSLSMWAATLLRRAKVDASTIAIVIKRMAQSDGEH